MPPYSDSDYLPVEQFLIPDEVKEYLRSKEILSLNRAQIQAIENGLLEDGNFVASTFTGTGKTIMAHIKMVQALKSGKKMIYIAPLKSIVVEKAKQDFKFYEKFGWKFIDSTDVTENERNRIKYENYDGIVMTFEKFDSILNKTGAMVEWLKNVGLVVVDEGHEISDEDRGAVLESALTKIRILTRDRIRILFLSAVLPNVETVAKWLKAKYCNIKWRPVDLEVGFVSLSNGKNRGNGWMDDFDDSDDEDDNACTRRGSEPETVTVRTGNISHITRVQQSNPLPDFRFLKPHEKHAAAQSWAQKALPNVFREENVTDAVWPMVKKTLAEGGQALVFCKSRPDSEKKARKISNFIAFQNNPSPTSEKVRKGRKSDEEKVQQTLPEIMAASELGQHDESFASVDDDEDVSSDKSRSWTLEQYARYLKQFDSQLYALVINGVAFHHAGLDLRARSKIEQAYREKKIKVIVSTPTLIAGVNLPARLVIFDSVMRFTDGGMRRIPKKEFVNGCGRAGRVGLDSVGIAVFVDKDFAGAVEYLNKPVEEVGSQLTRSALFQILCTMKRNEDMGMELTTVDEINKFFSMTFSHSLGINITVQEYIDTLEKYGLIRQYVQGAYRVTKLGAEAVNYYLHPGTAYVFSVLIDLMKAKVEGKNLELDEDDMTTAVRSVQIPDKITLDTIVHTVAQTKEFANHRKVKDKEIMHDYFEYGKKDFAINWSEEEPEIISAVMALHAKLEMYDLLPEHYAMFQKAYKNFGEGDFKMMQENMDWLLEAMLAIARVKLGHGSPAFQSISKIILTLKKRMKKMVREELVEVCRVKHIGRKRALVLKKLNILTLDAIVNPANEQKLREGLGNGIAEQVIEGAVQILARVKSTGINN